MITLEFIILALKNTIFSLGNTIGKKSSLVISFKDDKIVFIYSISLSDSEVSYSVCEWRVS